MGVERIMGIAMEIVRIVSEADMARREIESVLSRASAAIKGWSAGCSVGDVDVCCLYMFPAFVCRIDVKKGRGVLSIYVWFDINKGHRIKVLPVNVEISSLGELERFLPPEVFDGDVGGKLVECLSKELMRAEKIGNFLKALLTSIRLLS
jgi:hypothetical protein